MTNIQPYSGNMILLPHQPTRNEEKRLGLFISFLSDEGLLWHGNGNLEGLLYSYKESLEDQELAPSSINAYMSTVKSRYKKLLRSNSVRDLLFKALPSQDMSPSDAKAMVDEYVLRMRNALDSDDLVVSVTQVQDQQHLRLTARESLAFLCEPDRTTLAGLRDRAIIATLLCTGIRVKEMIDLEREDLYQEYEGFAALRVKSGKGDKSRLVPYGALDWFLSDVETWLSESQIRSGSIFQPLWKNGDVRGVKLTTEGVRNILHSYPIEARGKLLTVNPHDLRRTYARRLFESGMKVEAIQQNLGHAKIETTLQYIGDISAGMRASEVNPYER